MSRRDTGQSKFGKVDTYGNHIELYTHSLNFVIVVIIITSYSFSQASSATRTWLDELRCRGTESRLIDCPANTIGDEDCSHLEDVALVCSAGKSQ